MLCSHKPAIKNQKVSLENLLENLNNVTRQKLLQKSRCNN